jgi:hypothetical protein
MTAGESPKGHDKRLCGARKRQGVGTCRRPAGWGTDHVGAGHCKLHGGSTRDQKMSATEEMARRELAQIGIAPVDNPLSELAQVTAEVVAWKNVMAAKVNDLSSLRYSTEGGEQLRSEVALWERALDRCEKFLTAMARLDIDERLARVTERQAEQVSKALTAALAELGLSAEQQRDARTKVARHLRAV